MTAFTFTSGLGFGPRLGVLAGHHGPLRSGAGLGLGLRGVATQVGPRYGETLVRSTVSGASDVAVLHDVAGTWDLLAFGPQAATATCAA